MKDKVFCYHCRSFHLPSEVTLVHTASGERWRCLKSLASSRASRDQRDAFGKSVSQLNQLRRSVDAERTQPHCVRELFDTVARGIKGAA